MSLRNLRQKLTPPMPWRWGLFCLACLLSGLALACALRLIDCQSLRQTLSSLKQCNLWLTALFLGLVCAFLGFLSHSLFAGCIITFLPAYLLVLVNYYKGLITSVPLSLGDFSLIGQVGHIATLNADAITFSLYTVLSITGGVVWLALALFFSAPLRLRWRWSLPGAAAAAAAFVVIFWVNAGPLVYAPMGLDINTPKPQVIANQFSGGPVLGLWESLYQKAHNTTVHRDLGEEYSQEHMEELVEQAERFAPAQSPGPSRTPPNIVLILSESFFDISKLSGVAFDEDPAAGFHALQKEGVSGTFHTRSLGYGTCNIELEILTGINTGLMSGEDLYAMDPAVFSRLPSVVSLLKDRGYTADMLHMFNDEIYHRKGFFSQLDFDHLYFSDGLADFYPPAAEAPDYWAYMNSRIDGEFYSDDLMSDALIALYEKRASEGDAPAFLYGISMENHSTYTDKYSPEELTVNPQSALTGEAAENLLHVSQGISNASAALEKLADYFREVDEPTVVIFYGDHRPGLGLSGGGTVYSELGMVPAARGEWSLEQVAELYSTDYLIWSNDPAYLPGEPGSAEDASCNYLGGTVLDLGGVEKPLYWRLISELSQTRLCDTWDYNLGRDGALSDQPPQEGHDAEGLGLLREFLNDAVYGKQYVTGQISTAAQPSG